MSDLCKCGHHQQLWPHHVEWIDAGAVHTRDKCESVGDVIVRLRSELAASHELIMRLTEKMERATSALLAGKMREDDLRTSLAAAQREDTMTCQRWTVHVNKMNEEHARREAELGREVEMLRRYGNKDCTAMADAALANPHYKSEGKP
jgi:hypothetical protein